MSIQEAAEVPTGRPVAPGRHLRPVPTLTATSAARSTEPGHDAAPRVVVTAQEPDYVSCRNLLPLRLRSHRRFSPLCFGLVPLGPDGLAASCPVCGGPALY